MLECSQKASALASPESVGETLRIVDELIPLFVVHEPAPNCHVSGVIPEYRRTLVVLFCLPGRLFCVLVDECSTPMVPLRNPNQRLHLKYRRSVSIPCTRPRPCESPRLSFVAS